MLKIVIDTNVLIDGSTDDYNYCNRIINEVIAGDCMAFANHSTIRENLLLINRKVTDEGYKKRLQYFFNQLKPVDNVQVALVADDEEDNKILGSALAAQADYLITADHHLLKIGQVQRVKIVTPAEFWNRYTEDSNEGWLTWIKNFVK